MDNGIVILIIFVVVVFVVAIVIFLYFIFRNKEENQIQPEPIPNLSGVVTNQFIEPNQKQIINWFISGSHIMYYNGTFTLLPGTYFIGANLTYQPSDDISQRTIGVSVRDPDDMTMTNIIGVSTVGSVPGVSTTVILPLGFKLTIDKIQNVSIVTSQNSMSGLLVSGSMTLRHHQSGSPEYNGPAISLFQWNPHWQCFTNQCCYNVAIDYINSNIVSRNVDFANIIELEYDQYQPPSNYTKIVGHCGSGPITSGDVTTLIYNQNLWQPVGNAYKFCIADSTDANGRPTLIQQFTSKNQSNFNVYVVGSHFTHDRDSYISGLQNAFNTVGIQTTSQIIMMADTNQNGSSQKLISDILGTTPAVIQSTAISGTCCFSSFRLAYDRIITTFGNHMGTYAPSFNEVITNPVSGCNYGEMHLPVFGNLS
ncbi:MAG TPA: hypothetical protein VLG50_08040 [Candidatus Saccharimonadales bacterium]|nr:hypothetical protein [Candidatus Saccharimonadales bacterium]